MANSLHLNAKNAKESLLPEDESYNLYLEFCCKICLKAVFRQKDKYII